jgi:L-amino acid N-acyltransferase YncA
MNIRVAARKDWQKIAEIYNQAVEEEYATADTEPISPASRKEWFKQHSPEQYPIYLAESDGKIMGWCSLSPYRPGRKALRTVAEISYYVHRAHRRKGVADALMDHAIKNSVRLGFRNLMAILLDQNTASIRLLEKHGFRRWGHLPDIADFDGTVCGQFIYGRKV